MIKIAKTAVIVEDSKLAALAIKKALENLGYTVVEIVSDGNKAVEACKKNSPDLVTMDLNMPNLDGFEATQQILSANAALNIIIITERNLTEQDKQRLSGAKAIILKPITEEKIRAAIQKL